MKKNIDLDHTILSKLETMAAFENTSVKALIEKAVSHFVAEKEREPLDNLSDIEKEDLVLLLLMQQAERDET